MPKSRKRKNQDFQKVKLKVGKTRPKGDNVTNLSFKTKQIQLTQKIKDGEGQDLVTRRKLSIQDLLRQCDHHSCSARVNAVAGLKELWLTNHKEMMQLSNIHGYGAILQKIATLFIDNESVVRHSVISLFKVMLHKLSSTSKLPPRGFPVMHIHTYLCCAMAHIHEDIKLDALLLFDILLECFPSLLIHQTGDLLTNLLGFISAPISIGVRADSTTQRLTLNPDSKLPVMKFRQRVLMRIKQIFQIACGELSVHKKDHAALQNKIPVNHNANGEDGNKDKGLLQDTFIRNGMDQRFQSLFSGACHELTNYITNPSSLECFIQSSVPVLLQCWREARASVDTQEMKGNVISRDSSEVMSLVVNIIQLAFNLCSTKPLSTSSNNEETLVPVQLLVDTHATEFERLFMSDFPYSIQVEVKTNRKRKREKKNPINNAPVSFSLDDLNLCLCEIMSHLSCCTTFQQKDIWMPRVQSHLIKLLGKKLTTEQAQTIIRTIEKLHCSSSLTLDSPVFATALDCFASCSANSLQKTEFFKLFWLIVYGGKRKEHSSNSDQLADKVYSLLPGVLLTVIRDKMDIDWALDILTLMIHGHSSWSKVLLECLLQSMTDLLDPKNGVPSCQHEAIVQRFFFLLSMGTPLKREHYKQILDALKRPAFSQRLVCQILQSLTDNVMQLVPFTNQLEFNKMMPEQHECLSQYLSFMVSLQLGFHTEELEQRSPVSHDSLGQHPWQFEYTLDGDQWNRHKVISSFVMQALISIYIPPCPSKGYPEPFTLMSNIEQMWTKALFGRSKMHITTAYSLMQLVLKTSQTPIKTKPSEEFYSFASEVLAYMCCNLHCSDLSSLAATDVVWELKELLIKTLHQDSPLLVLVWKTLIALAKDQGVEKQAVTTAKDFLLSDAIIKDKISLF